MSLLSEDPSFFSFDNPMDISEFFSSPGEDLLLSGESFQPDVSLRVCAEESGVDTTTTATGGVEEPAASASGSTEGDEGGWTKDDTIRLTELVKFYGPNWDEVAKSFDGQTHSPEECHQQYQNLIDYVTKQNQLQLLETADESEPTGSPTPSDYLFSSPGDGSIDPYYMQTLNDSEVHVIEMGSMADFNPAGVHHAHHSHLMDLTSVNNGCSGATLAQVIEMNPLSALGSMGITMEVCQPMNPVPHHQMQQPSHPQLQRPAPEPVPVKSAAEMAASMTSVIVAPRKNIKKPSSRKKASPTVTGASSTPTVLDKAARKAQRRAEKAKRREERRKRREKREKHKSKKERKDKDNKDAKDIKEAKDAKDGKEIIKDAKKDKKKKDRKDKKREKREKKNQRRVEKMTFTTTILDLGPSGKPSSKKRKEPAPSSEGAQACRVDARETKKARKSSAITGKISTMKITKVKTEPGPEAESHCIPPAIVAAAAAAANAASLAGVKAHAQFAAQAQSFSSTLQMPTSSSPSASLGVMRGAASAPANGMSSRMPYPMIIPRFQHSILPAGMPISSPSLVPLHLSMSNPLQPQAPSTPCSPAAAVPSSTPSQVLSPVPSAADVACSANLPTPIPPVDHSGVKSPAMTSSETPAATNASADASADGSMASMSVEAVTASASASTEPQTQSLGGAEPPSSSIASPTPAAIPQPASVPILPAPSTVPAFTVATNAPLTTSASGEPTGIPATPAGLAPISPKMTPRASLPIPPGLLNTTLAPYSLGVLPRVNGTHMGTAAASPTTNATSTPGSKRKKGQKEDVSTLANASLSPDGTDKNGSPKKRKRRTAAEIERKYKCEMPNCTKAYGSEGALKMHVKLKHPGVKQPTLKTPTTPSGSNNRLTTPQPLPLLLQFPLPFMPGMVPMGSQPPLFPAPAPGSATAAAMMAAATSNGAHAMSPNVAQPALSSTSVKSPLTTAPATPTGNVPVSTDASQMVGVQPLAMSSSSDSLSPSVAAAQSPILSASNSPRTAQTDSNTAHHMPILASPSTAASEGILASTQSSSELAVFSPQTVMSPSDQIPTAEIMDASQEKIELASSSQDESMQLESQLPSSPLSRSASDLILDTLGDTALLLPSTIMPDVPVAQCDGSLQPLPGFNISNERKQQVNGNRVVPSITPSHAISSDAKSDSLLLATELSDQPYALLDLNAPAFGFEGEELERITPHHFDLVAPQAPYSPVLSHAAESL